MKHELIFVFALTTLVLLLFFNNQLYFIIPTKNIETIKNMVNYPNTFVNSS